jgi:hypothetical protein
VPALAGKRQLTAEVPLPTRASIEPALAGIHVMVKPLEREMVPQPDSMQAGVSTCSVGGAAPWTEKAGTAAPAA